MYYNQPLGDYNKDGIDITKYIVNIYSDEKGDIHDITIKTKENYYSFGIIPQNIESKSDFSMILTNAKILFSIPYLEYNLVRISKNSKEQKYLIFNGSEYIHFREYIKHRKIKSYNLYKLRRLICFNWLMNVKIPLCSKKLISNMRVQHEYSSFCITDIKNTDDVSFYFINEELASKSNIKDSEFHTSPESLKLEIDKLFSNIKIIRDYFKDENEFRNLESKIFKDENPTSNEGVLERYKVSLRNSFIKRVLDLIEKIDPEKVKYELLKIVQEYNEDYIPWVNLVYERILNAKKLLI